MMMFLKKDGRKRQTVKQNSLDTMEICESTKSLLHEFMVKWA